jgi:hypothetical protein
MEILVFALFIVVAIWGSLVFRITMEYDGWDTVCVSIFVFSAGLAFTLISMFVAHYIT